MSGTVTRSRGRDSCLEIRNVGECDSTSLASSKVVENPGVYFSKATEQWLVLLTVMLSPQQLCCPWQGKIESEPEVVSVTQLRFVAQIP